MTPPLAKCTDRLVFDQDGLNTAAALRQTAANFLTPTDQFFTRSHAPVPAVDAATWRLDVSGLVGKRLRLSLDDLESRLPRRELAATLVCAGLRRNEFLALGPLPGELPWGAEPASTGRWAGVSLRDLIALAGIADGARHVALTGLDTVVRHGRQFGFGGSIPIEKAMSPEVLLAFELNGEPLRPENGFPVRLVVPGWVGARSVKWLAEIVLQREPSTNYFQTKAYRVERTPNPHEPRDVSGGEALGELTINAAILTPEPGAQLAAGKVRLAGWAIGNHARLITRVDVSTNGGAVWKQATVALQSDRWTWAFWQAEVTLEPGRHLLTVRAWDDSGACQPADLAQVWNVKGYLNNAWHRVPVEAR
ncbi:MAG: sulfite oxidase [Gemmatimonadota bacterium]